NHSAASYGRLNLWITEREHSSRVAMHKVQGDDCDQHQHRTNHGVKDEFDGCINSPLTTPDTDQEIHGHQHDFPEHIKQKQVERTEDSDHSRFEQQHENEVFLQTSVNGPGGENSQRGEQCSQEDQKNTDSIDTHRVVDAERGNPWHFNGELKVRVSRIEGRNQMK